MKNSGKCPKCGSQEMWVKRGGAYHYGSIIYGLGFRRICVDFYCCVDRGYTERWVRDSDMGSLRAVKAKP